MVIKLAFRNLRRHLRRTIITVAAIGLGTGLALFSIGLGDGGHQQMIENGVRIGQGHLTVQRDGFLESPSSSLYIEDPDPFMAIIWDSPYVDRAFPRIRGEGILATAAGAEGVMFQGIDPSAPGEAAIFKDSLSEGEFLTDYNAARVYLGTKLADRLKLKLGKKAVLTTQDAAGEITSTLLRVQGIFKSGSGTIDGSICIIPIGFLQEALSMGRGVTSIAIYLNNPFKQEHAFEEIGSQLPRGQTYLYKWQVLQPDLRDYVVIDDAFGYMIYAVILLIVAIGVLNTVLMSVMERRREIGILTALGMENRHVMLMVLVETVFITLLGILFGLAIGLGVNWYFSTYGLDLSQWSPEEWSLAGTVIDPVLRSHLRPHRAFGLCFLVFLLTVTMGIYPAWKASRTLPVEAMEKP
ncbi:MAG: FtsX-like permease family protein [bacterium]|nr:FtsX-like permease family protein [bacterium]MDT8367194.1 FtsX-like permease family protein [bacterium]